MDSTEPPNRPPIASAALPPLPPGPPPPLPGLPPGPPPGQGSVPRSKPPPVLLGQGLVPSLNPLLPSLGQEPAVPSVPLSSPPRQETGPPKEFMPHHPGVESDSLPVPSPKLSRAPTPPASSQTPLQPLPVLSSKPACQLSPAPVLQVFPETSLQPLPKPTKLSSESPLSFPPGALSEPLPQLLSGPLPSETLAAIPMHPVKHTNGSIETSAFLPQHIPPVSSGRSQDHYGLELQYSGQYPFQFTHPPPVSETIFPGLPYFPPISVPPPMFQMPQPNFSIPPPLMKHPPPSYAASPKVGIPFPPPGYDLNMHVTPRTSSHDALNSKILKDTKLGGHPVQSKSPNRSLSRSSSSHQSSHYKRRSRSRSYSKGRSQSRSRSNVPSKSSHDHRRRSSSRRRSRSRSGSKRPPRSGSFRNKRSRTRSRSRLRSRSHSSRKRSRSANRRSQRSRSPSWRTASRSNQHLHKISKLDRQSYQHPRSVSHRDRSRSQSRTSNASKLARTAEQPSSRDKTSGRSHSRDRTARRSHSRDKDSRNRTSRQSHSPSRSRLKRHSPPARSPKATMNVEPNDRDNHAKDEAFVRDLKKKDIGGSINVQEEDCSLRKETRNIIKCNETSSGKRNISLNGKGKGVDESSNSRLNRESSVVSVRSSQSTQVQRSKSERETLVERWRLNNCKNLEEMASKLEVLSKMEADEIIELEKQTWTRSAPADLYYKRNSQHPSLMEATPKLLELCEKFDSGLVQRAECVRKTFSTEQSPPRETKFRNCKHTAKGSSSSSSSCDESSSDEEDKAMMELERKRKHPQRLHSELWHNEPGEMNDGPLCRCSHRARKSGIRHNVYVGEQKLEKCNIDANNAGKLYHYRITMSPPVNFLTKTPTIIEHDSHEYIFEGFSMLSHFPLVKLPTCKVIRFNIEYTILYVDEAMPENFTIRELDLFYNYLFHEVLELLDLDLKAFGDPNGCNQFHFMPRFVRDLPENGKEILSMNEVLKYLLKSNKPLVPEERLNEIYNMSLYDWQTFADEVKCMVVTKPGMKPCSLRVDQLDRETMDEGRFPEIVHFGIRPPQLSYAGNTEYQKHWKEYVKFRHLLANMPKPSAEDKRKLMGKENRLQEMRTVSKMKRDVTIALASDGFYRTGIMCDIIQHALLLPVLVCHLRFHKSLDQLEEDMDYKFKNRYLLQLALTHPSYRENFGTNPDHARNSLTNCGIRQPEYGDRRIHYMNTRKRGINTLIQIMSRFGKKEATESNIGHNERLEFLGDAVVEFITSIHLFHLFPDLEEGGLATYRAAIVQNQHLAVMARRLNLDSYMLYAHGSDLCHDLELRHAMANCFEALMGALFLDGGIEVADKVFGFTLWKEEFNLADVWMNYPLHPLQEQEPAGDRQWIQHFPVLQKLTGFESRIGIVFKHIRLLARAFTDRSVGFTNLTLGSNQRLEFLGDTVLQIIASEYLYKFFPEHHEGHLSLLRSSLVNNRTQAVVCDDLGMTEFALYANPKHDIKTKDRADLLEAFLGALYIDNGLKHCHLFCEVCFFPRLQDFIMNQDWNDPKSKLQQCCLTLRTMEGGEPDIPVYKVIQCMGPTNTRIYTVAVYFRGERLAQASGHSIQQAEMNAANEALELSTELFPQLDHQRRVIAKSMKKQKKRARREAALRAARELERAAEEKKSRGRSLRHDQRDQRSRNRDDIDRNRQKDKDRIRDKGKNCDRGGVRERDKERERERDRDRERVRERDYRENSQLKDKEGRSREDRDRTYERDRRHLRTNGHGEDRGVDREKNRERASSSRGADASERGRRDYSRSAEDNKRQESSLTRENSSIKIRKCEWDNLDEEKQDLKSLRSHRKKYTVKETEHDLLESATVREHSNSVSHASSPETQSHPSVGSKSRSSCNSSPSRSRGSSHDVCKSIGSLSSGSSDVSSSDFDEHGSDEYETNDDGGFDDTMNCAEDGGNNGSESVGKNKDHDEESGYVVQWNKNENASLLCEDESSHGDRSEEEMHDNSGFEIIHVDMSKGRKEVNNKSESERIQSEDSGDEMIRGYKKKDKSFQSYKRWEGSSGEETEGGIMQYDKSKDVQCSKCGEDGSPCSRCTSSKNLEECTHSPVNADKVTECFKIVGDGAPVSINVGDNAVSIRTEFDGTHSTSHDNGDAQIVRKCEDQSPKSDISDDESVHSGFDGAMTF